MARYGDDVAIIDDGFSDPPPAVAAMSAMASRTVEFASVAATSAIIRPVAEGEDHTRTYRHDAQAAEPKRCKTPLRCVRTAGVAVVAAENAHAERKQ